MSNKEKENLVIIDADSIIYYIAYDLSALLLEPLGISKLDDFIKDILVTTRSKNYIGFFAGKGGKNFRYDLATTKDYKGTRSKEKEDWYIFWEPILKKHMETTWGFTPVYTIEADDACAIAANSFKDEYNVIIASPDKDLIQIPEVWFYNYNKRIKFYCTETLATQSLCKQLILGDTSDNIPGCKGAGKVTAEKFILDNASANNLLEKTKDFYIYWHTKVLRDKLVKKQEKEYLDKYKEDNNIKRLTKNIKSEALSKFVPDESEILSEEEVIKYFDEQYSLLKLLDSEEKGKKYNFSLPEIQVADIDLDEIIQDENLSIVDDDEGIQLLEDMIKLEEKLIDADEDIDSLGEL